MDIRRFKEALPTLLMTSSGDAAFSSLRIATHGMAGVRTAKILNFACRCMAFDEFYLEVGTFSGYTLISAGYQLNSICMGVDDFSLSGLVKKDALAYGQQHVRARLSKNIGEHGALNTKFIESDFRKLVLTEDSRGKLSVLFIDGEHTYQDVKDTIEKFSPFLSKDAIVIFDDVQYGKIPAYIAEMLQSGQWEMLVYVISTSHPNDVDIHKNMFMDEFIANGICIMRRLSDA